MFHIHTCIKKAPMFIKTAMKELNLSSRSYPIDFKTPTSKYSNAFDCQLFIPKFDIMPAISLS
jgi:hypothetical protein